MIEALAPAKVNLGLEILGKRDDGYHEVRTILCALSVFDVLEVHQSRMASLEVDDIELEVDNLVDRAVALARSEYPSIQAPSIRLHKRIPTAAGLGGASSDAATTLLAMQRLHPDLLDECTLFRLASKLGSDVPFFLKSGLAIASGRGVSLQQLPLQRVDIVIISPSLSIPDKTATMYGQLNRSDWSDGVAVDGLAKGISTGESLLVSKPLPNAFSRALYALEPSLMSLAAHIGQLTDLPVQLSGAGPAHFVICRDDEHRQWVRDRLRPEFASGGVRVLAGRSVPSVLLRES